MDYDSNHQTAAPSPSSSTRENVALYGGHAPVNTGRKPITTTRIAAMHAQGDRIAMLTAYDATFAARANAAGVDSILVGDSLGMVCQGASSTVSVTLDSMVYHTRCVAQGLSRCNGAALLVADLPFGSYQQSKEKAIVSATALMQAGAQMVKLEGGGWASEVVAFLVDRGIPVCGHIGLTPQTVSALGGYRVQGRDQAAAERLHADAIALGEAGASMIVLEMVPAVLAAAITSVEGACPTIGIGAGNGTSGQVLVMHDMLGISLGRAPKFVKNFMEGVPDIDSAFAAYVAAVKNGQFPNNDAHAW